MPCGCQAACGCDVQAGAGIQVTRIGDRIVVTNTQTEPTAADVAYDAAASGLAADDVQDAIDELAARPSLEVVRGYYDFDQDGGAVGIIPLRDALVGGDPLELPEGAIIVNTIVNVTESILPDELDPNPGGAEIEFQGGVQQLQFFQGPAASGGEVLLGNPSAVARSFTPGGTPLVLNVFDEITGGALEVVFLVIPAP